MNTKLYGLIFFVFFVVLISGCYIFATSDKKKSSQTKIALVVPAVHPSMDAIEKSFVTTLKTKMPEVSVDVYNANGNKTLLKGQVEKITREGYDVCCTIGTNASQIMATILEKNQSIMPLIAVAVSPDVAHNLSHHYHYSTGITDKVDKKEQVAVLMALKKVKAPLLVYDPSSNPAFENEKKEYEKLFETYGVTLSSLAVYSVQEVYQKLAGTIAAHDVVMTLTDHTVCSAMDALIKLCNQHGVTLYTSELDSNDKGAALSYGVQEREYGVKAAHLLQEIHEHKVIPSFIKSGPFYLKINKDAIRLQNVVIPAINSLPDVTIIYKGDTNA